METIIVIIMTCINSLIATDTNSVNNSEADVIVTTSNVDGNGNSDTGQIRH